MESEGGKGDTEVKAEMGVGGLDMGMAMEGTAVEGTVVEGQEVVVRVAAGEARAVKEGAQAAEAAVLGATQAPWEGKQEAGRLGDEERAAAGKASEGTGVGGLVEGGREVAEKEGETLEMVGYERTKQVPGPVVVRVVVVVMRALEEVVTAAEVVARVTVGGVMAAEAEVTVAVVVVMAAVGEAMARVEKARVTVGGVMAAEAEVTVAVVVVMAAVGEAMARVEKARVTVGGVMAAEAEVTAAEVVATAAEARARAEVEMGPTVAKMADEVVPLEARPEQALPCSRRAELVTA